MRPPSGGHRPSNANDKAPLPTLGKLSRSLLSVFTQGTVQQQAGVLPGTPGYRSRRFNNVRHSLPAAAQPQPGAQPAPPIDAGTTSLVGWVTGDQSAGGDTLQRFGISGTDPGSCGTTATR